MTVEKKVDKFNQVQRTTWKACAWMVVYHGPPSGVRSHISK